MKGFMQQYYPGIRRKLHENRILALQELLETEKLKYKKEYDVEFNL